MFCIDDEAFTCVVVDVTIALAGAVVDVTIELAGAVVCEDAVVTAAIATEVFCEEAVAVDTQQHADRRGPSGPRRIPGATQTAARRLPASSEGQGGLSLEGCRC